MMCLEFEKTLLEMSYSNDHSKKNSLISEAADLTVVCFPTEPRILALLNHFYTKTILQNTKACPETSEHLFKILHHM